MNRLAAILDPRDVKVELVVESKLALFVQAALLFEHHGWAGALSTVADTLMARERLASTCLGHGVAMPHGRLKGLKSPSAAVIRLKDPLPFGSADALPVSLFVFLFVPEAATQSHLEILGEIAEMLSDAPLRERLQKEAGAHNVHATITGWLPAAGSRAA